MAEFDTKIEVIQGADYSEGFVFLNASPTGGGDPTTLVPWDLTGCTARMMVRPSPDPQGTCYLSLAGGAGVSAGSPTGLAFFPGTTTPGPAIPAYNNSVRVTIVKAASLAMNAGRPTVAYYDLFVDFPDGTSQQMLRGTFQLSGSATR
jgi:hypothetical protein